MTPARESNRRIETSGTQRRREQTLTGRQQGLRNGLRYVFRFYLGFCWLRAMANATSLPCWTQSPRLTPPTPAPMACILPPQGLVVSPRSIIGIGIGIIDKEDEVEERKKPNPSAPRNSSICLKCTRRYAILVIMSLNAWGRPNLNGSSNARGVSRL